MKRSKLFILIIGLVLVMFTSCMTTDGQPRPHYNTKNLRNNARFEVKVANDVWWVPANVLGKTRYSNEQIAEMVYLEPEEKQALISNLYEAIQLYQVSNYSDIQTNKRIYNNKTRIDWELHVDGYNAVRINKGNCAGSTAWLNYILSGDYDEVGCIGWIGMGGGHVINYFKQDGYYYFIDMTHYRMNWLHSAVEDGSMESYKSVDFILGNIHKAKSVKAYVDYIEASCSRSNDPSCIYYMYAEENPINLGGGGGNITFPQDKKDIIEIIYYKKSSGFKYNFANSPEGVSYEWTEELWPTAEINPITRF